MITAMSADLLTTGCSSSSPLPESPDLNQSSSQSRRHTEFDHFRMAIPSSCTTLAGGKHTVNLFNLGGESPRSKMWDYISTHGFTSTYVVSAQYIVNDRVAKMLVTGERLKLCVTSTLSGGEDVYANRIFVCDGFPPSTTVVNYVLNRVGEHGGRALVVGVDSG